MKTQEELLREHHELVIAQEKEEQIERLLSSLLPVERELLRNRSLEEIQEWIRTTKIDTTKINIRGWQEVEA